MQKSHLPGELIREIRKRKGLRQTHLQGLCADGADSQVTLSRIENLRQNPSKMTLLDLLDRVELPYRQFFCPYMEDQPAETFVLRGQIAYLLDRAEGDAAAQALARERIERLHDLLDLDSLINRQLWLSLRCALDVMEGRCDDETLARIEAGLRLTYPEFDRADFSGGVLVFYECELLLSLARCLAARGEPGEALAILTHVRTGYEKQPVGDMHKEVLLGELQNLMVRNLLAQGDYPAALHAAEEAVAHTKKLSGSSRLPDALHLLGMALFYAEGDRDRAAALLRQAYFAFALLGRRARQAQVLRDAREVLGVQFETHGAERIVPPLPRDFFSFGTGSALAVDSIGALLRQFRLAAGAKQAEIYTGICSRSFYSRLEAGERTGVGIFILEALMQRLGRDLNLYIEYFSSIDEWEESNLRTRYARELYIGNADEAQATLARLQAVGNFTDGLGRQFLLFSQGILKWMQGEVEASVALLFEAIRQTIPDFREDTVAEHRLTFHECNILNGIANYYCEYGQIERGIALYLGIRESLHRFYVDDSIKARYYTTLLSNLALEHYNTGRYAAALEFAEECESICRRYGVLFLLNLIAHRKTHCLHALGRREEALAYAAMTYYSGNLSLSEKDLTELAAFAEAQLGVAFSRDLGFVFHAERAGTYTETEPDG